MDCIKKLDELVTLYSDELDIIKNITPVNLNQENEKFLELFHKNCEYNPQYIYEVNNKIDKIYNKIAEMTFADSIIGRIYSSYKDYILNSIKLMNSINNVESFTSKSISLFGKPDKDLINKAFKILKDDRTAIVDTCSFDANFLYDTFIKELEKYRFKWKVELIDTMSSKVAVDAVSKTIYINACVKFSETDIKRLLVHEIGTHVVRAENGSQQPYLIFENGFPNSIETEEGLATYNESKANLLDIRTLKIYAGRVLAVDWCLNNSFYNVFFELSKYFEEKEALRIVSRIKRGLTDTSCNGGFTKDFVYLNGYYKIKKYINKDNEILLYTGAIGIDDIDNVSRLVELGEITLPRNIFNI